MTDVPLKEYIEAQICALRREVTQKLNAMQVVLDGRAKTIAALWGVGSSVLVGIVVGIILAMLK